MEGKERRETTPKQSTLKFRRRENEHKETAPCILDLRGPGHRHRGRSGPDGHPRRRGLRQDLCQALRHHLPEPHQVHRGAHRPVLHHRRHHLHGGHQKAGLGGREDHRLLHVHHRPGRGHRPGAGQPVPRLLPAPGQAGRRRVHRQRPGELYGHPGEHLPRQRHRAHALGLYAPGHRHRHPLRRGHPGGRGEGPGVRPGGGQL